MGNSNHIIRASKPEETIRPQDIIFRSVTTADIPELKELFCNTVLTVNARDYTTEEVADWLHAVIARDTGRNCLQPCISLLPAMGKAASSALLPSETTDTCTLCSFIKTIRDRASPAPFCNVSKHMPLNMESVKSLRK